MAKRMLADVLWEAANVYLSTKSECSRFPEPENYSCCALARAINPKTDDLPQTMEKFVSSLGCNPCGAGFEDIEAGMKRQGVRYMWLLLAMHVAADEGIEV